MREFLKTTRNYIFLAIIIWFTFTFFLGMRMAPNDDMKPRISAGDILLYYRLDKNINAQDVIALEKNDTFYIGRVIAKEGDTIDITKKSKVVLNGNTITEENIYYETPPYEGFTDYPVTLGKGEYFILVDKRTGGEDSRYYGIVHQNEIKGSVIGLLRRVNL
jgi:signal peptidase I